MKNLARRRKLLMALLVVLALASLALALYPLFRPPVRFESVQEFRDFAKKHNLHVWPQDDLGIISCYAAERPLDVDQIGELTPAGSEANPNWRGIAWVVANADEYRAILGDTVGVPTRTWGHLIAAGDPDMLNRIEALWHEEAKAASWNWFNWK